MFLRSGRLEFYKSELKIVELLHKNCVEYDLEPFLRVLFYLMDLQVGVSIIFLLMSVKCVYIPTVIAATERVSEPSLSSSC